MDHGYWLCGRSWYRSWKNFVTTRGNEEAYGLAYRIIRKRVSPDTVLHSLATVGGSHTLGWNDSAVALLNSLIPDCDPELREDIGARYRDWESTREAALPWTPTEVAAVLKSLSNGKAPGPDLIEAEMIKRFRKYPHFLTFLTGLFNKCLEVGNFPKPWKVGTIRVLLKSPDKDPSVAKSYRPICLLSLFGKTLEKLIRLRLRSIVLHEDYASASQYG